jgi:hypothetical protein
VEIFRYVTEGTFDSYLFQLVENKQKFIGQIMTSKSPVRTAADVDETALSYAEIKALATGNPAIIEKSNLEMEVAKLRVLQGGHLSQRYEMEDMVRLHYPSQIRAWQETAENHTQDIALLSAHPPSAEEGKLSPMVIEGVTYTDKKQAGTALLEACKALHGTEALDLGSYRGFRMSLSFEAFSKEYRLTLKNAGSYMVVLGADVRGNLTRIDNAQEGLPEKKRAAEQEIERLTERMEAAKAAIEVPFPQEEELQQKQARLSELNVALNLDVQEPVVIDGEAPDEGDATAPVRKKSVPER